MTKLAILLRTSFLILTLVCASQTMARSQKYKVTIKVKEQKLLDVFKSIQQQTNLIVFYSNTILNDQEKVSIQVKDEPLEKVLDQIIAGKALKYEVQEKYIVIAPKEEKKGVKEIKEGASEEDVAPLPPPTIDVSGKITDEDGNPLMGASVMIKGTKIGTQTNADGLFSLKGVDEKAILEISFVGFIKREQAVGLIKTSRTIILKRDNSPLDDVQIIAYGKQTQRFSVGNVTTVKGEDIQKQPVLNPLLALQGRVPGLEVTQVSGINGGAVTVRIQGVNSIANGLDPLIVVDGVPYPSQLQAANPGVSIPIGTGSPLNYINPNDIESIEVLKDADATAIYGSRAANGALLITTKRGKPGKINVTLNLQQGWGKVTRKLEMLNTRQYLDMRYEAYRNDGIDWRQSNISADDLKVWDTTRYTDWQKELIGGTASYTNTSLTVSGGTSAIQYLIGTTFNRTTTVFPGNTADKRNTIHFNIGSTSANQRFRIQLSGSYMINDNKLPGFDLTNRAITFEPNAPALYNSDGSLNWAQNASGTSTWDNPLVYTESRNFSNSTRTLVSSSNISYKILPGLEIKTNLGYTELRAVNFLPLPAVAQKPERRPTYLRTAVFGNSIQTSWILEPQLIYNTKLSNLRLDFLMGSTLQKNASNYLSVTGGGQASDQLLRNLSAASRVVASSGENAYKYAAVFARVNSVWQEKYILNINFRRDGSSRFGDNNKFEKFGSIGAGWIFSQEKLVKQNLPFLSFGKLRGSWGTTGSDQIGDYQYLSLYGSTTPQMPYQGLTGLYPQALTNPYLQWELTKKLQVGADIGFFKDRFLIYITYARNRSGNQLLNYQLPSMTGFNNILTNFPAVVQNTSWEFTIRTKNLESEKLSWISNLNFTLPSNKLISFPNLGESSYANSLIEGEPLGVIRMVRFVGVDPATGRYVVADANGNPTSASSGTRDRILASPFTNFHVGFNNSITWGNFQCDFLLQFVKQIGDQFYSADRAPGVFAAGNSNQPVTVMQRWQKPGDISSLARFISTGSTGPPRSSTDANYTYDASFIRLKNLSIAWIAPEPILRKLKIQSAKIFLQAQNLLTITRYAGLDPETRSIDNLPPLRMIAGGIQISF